MRANEVTASRVAAVLLADGWHRVVPRSFSVGPLGLGTGADLGVPGFRFEEADAGSPYQPTLLAGPLDSVIAVRQIAPSARRIGDADRPAHNGHRADPGAQLRVHAGHWLAEGSRQAR